jgi:hypothetical protein
MAPAAAKEMLIGTASEDKKEMIKEVVSSTINYTQK